jgi:hypothetical protein
VRRRHPGGAADLLGDGEDLRVAQPAGGRRLAAESMGPHAPTRASRVPAGGRRRSSPGASSTDRRPRPCVRWRTSCSARPAVPNALQPSGERPCHVRSSKPTPTSRASQAAVPGRGHRSAPPGVDRGGGPAPAPLVRDHARGRLRGAGAHRRPPLAAVGLGAAPWAGPLRAAGQTCRGLGAADASGPRHVSRAPNRRTVTPAAVASVR